MGDEREGLRPRFVDGVGPPLAQIIEDYAGERTTPARDVVGLAIEVLRLDGVVGQLTQELDEQDGYWAECCVVQVERAELAERRITELEATLEAIEDNAESWHAGEEAKARALVVIAESVRSVLSTSKEETA